jgi:hypothetical protein
LTIHRLNLALTYFEKAIDSVIAAKGDSTSDLISLYEEIAQIEQLRRNHGQAIRYLNQVSALDRWPLAQFPEPEKFGLLRTRR